MWKLMLVGIAATAIGCAHGEKPQAATPVAQREHPVIVSVVSRHSVVTISASERGPLYSVKTDAGKLLVADATLEELKRDHADVYQQIAPAIARGDVWADTARR